MTTTKKYTVHIALNNYADHITMDSNNATQLWAWAIKTLRDCTEHTPTRVNFSVATLDYADNKGDRDAIKVKKIYR